MWLAVSLEVRSEKYPSPRLNWRGTVNGVVIYSEDDVVGIQQEFSLARMTMIDADGA